MRKCTKVLSEQLPSASLIPARQVRDFGGLHACSPQPPNQSGPWAVPPTASERRGLLVAPKSPMGLSPSFTVAVGMGGIQGPYKESPLSWVRLGAPVGSQSPASHCLLLAWWPPLSLAQHAGLLAGHRGDQGRAPATALLRLDECDLAAGRQPAHAGVEPLLEAEQGKQGCRRSALHSPPPCTPRPPRPRWPRSRGVSLGDPPSSWSGGPGRGRRNNPWGPGVLVSARVPPSRRAPARGRWAPGEGRRPRVLTWGAACTPSRPRPR